MKHKGMSELFLHEKPAVLSKRLGKALLPSRPADSNKATFGNVLNIAGSVNYRGAAFLSSIAALKAGAGYSTLACLQTVADSVASLCPEIVTIVLASRSGSIDSGEIQKVVELAKKYKAISIGCGLFSYFSENSEVKNFFRGFIDSLGDCAVPVIIDADGITIVSESHGIHLPPLAVMTPHPLELARLMGVDVSVIQADRVRFAKEAARKYSAVIVLKGHRTIVTDGTAAFINHTGNSALAKAGSGDVLTGMLAGFCAQGLSPLDSACLSVYLHGKAADLARRELSEYSVLSSDLLRFIPRAIRTIA